MATDPPTRRAFLGACATLGVAGLDRFGSAASLLGVPSPVAGRATGDTPRSSHGAEPSAPFHPPITLAQWSVHRATFNGDLSPLDFPREARRYGIDGVEFVNQFYQSMPSDGPWIGELSRRCSGEGVRSHLVMCDGEGDLGDPDSARRANSVERHLRWLETAARLGCHSIRVNARSSGSPDEQRRLLADGLHALCVRAEAYSLGVLVENHGGQSSDGEWLAGVLRAVGHPAIGALPDFGNFRRTPTEWADRYVGVQALLPLARALSAKSYDFNPAGEETTIDFARMVGLARDARYPGAIGIEYEGRRLSEHQGILATKRLLEKLGARAASA